jgi:hypothetical protein
VPGLVLEEHRPTLADLARPRLARLPRWARWSLAAVALLVVLVVAWRILAGGDTGTHYVQCTPLAFNFHYSGTLHQVAARAPELVRLERRRDGLFLDSFAVEPLSLPPFGGEVSGALPAYAVEEIAALHRRFPQFELLREGKSRLNQVPGYEVQFQARLGKRRLYGRDVLLPAPAPNEDLANPSEVLHNERARNGVRILLLATPASGVTRVRDVGAHGLLKTPFRSFRFGTEGP